MVILTNKYSNYPALARYYASRIEAGKLKYETVVKKYPMLKDDIDKYLIADGYPELIVEV